ncbi:lytic murein transglycosylase [Alteromonas sediminis]|nr:lytic murein transglycosylase [Alteromonas sediminis]
MASEAPSAAEAFEACKPSLVQRAVESGLAQTEMKAVIDALQYQARVIELDRRQPEFVQTFPDYFSKRVNAWRINKGREHYAKHKEFLQKLNNQYGIPPHYLLAFWGLETNYGGYKGKMPVLDSLATLACDPRRTQYFTQELVVALGLMVRESLSPSDMLGSWAGAMGHTQFMPSAYQNYAIDGDGDGTINLWQSEQDALASAANFLSQLGWKPGFRWGREVQLANGFDYALIGRSNKRSVSEWAKLGVSKADGSSLGQADIKGYLVVPSGHTGPKFLVYDNFRTIMRWNNSEFYAIAVGHLADKIAGAVDLVTPLPELPTYSLASIKKLQTFLNENGIDVGRPDGILGPMTREGIRTAQRRNSMTADGFPSKELMDMAGVSTN